jgi:hypothetical protein
MILKKIFLHIFIPEGLYLCVIISGRERVSKKIAVINE